MPALGPWITALSALYLVSMMFALGLELGGQPKESKGEKRVKQRMLVWGLAFNLLVLPAVAFGITRALALDGSDVTIALLLLVAAPGGRFAPHIVKLGQGNLPLSVEITLFLAKLTAFTAAPTTRWMLTLKSLELRELPFIVQLLALQLVPFWVGKWLRRKQRPLADKMIKPAYYLSIGAAVVTLLVVLFKGDQGVFELLGDRGWIGVGVVLVAFPILGWFAGGGRRANRKTFAIMSNARELALALVIASLAYPNRGVHTALFGIWSVMALVTIALATILHSPKPATNGGEVRAGGPALGAPEAVRSAPAR